MSAESLNYCASSGLIPELIGELTGEDVLVRYVGEFAKEILKTLINLFLCVFLVKPFSEKRFICLSLIWLECQMLYTLI